MALRETPTKTTKMKEMRRQKRYVNERSENAVADSVDCKRSP